MNLPRHDSPPLPFLSPMRAPCTISHPPVGQMSFPHSRNSGRRSAVAKSRATFQGWLCPSSLGDPGMGKPCPQELWNHFLHLQEGKWWVLPDFCGSGSGTWRGQLCPSWPGGSPHWLPLIQLGGLAPLLLPLIAKGGFEGAGAWIRAENPCLRAGGQWLTLITS